MGEFHGCEGLVTWSCQRVVTSVSSWHFPDSDRRHHFAKQLQVSVNVAAYDLSVSV